MNDTNTSKVFFVMCEFLVFITTLLIASFIEECQLDLRPAKVFYFTVDITMKQMKYSFIIE